MKPETRAMLEMMLRSDETIPGEARFWFAEILAGRLPGKEGPKDGPLLKLVDAAKALGVSDPTFAQILKELPADLPIEFKPQQIKQGLVRIPPRLIWWIGSQRGTTYCPVARGRNGGRFKAAA